MVLGSFKPCLIFSHPILHVLLSLTRVIHYISMSVTVMRAKCIHPFFECFTFRRYFAQVALKSFHIFHLIESSKKNIPQGLKPCEWQGNELLV